MQIDMNIVELEIAEAPDNDVIQFFSYGVMIGGIIISIT